MQTHYLPSRFSIQPVEDRIAPVSFFLGGQHAIASGDFQFTDGDPTACTLQTPGVSITQPVDPCHGLYRSVLGGEDGFGAGPAD